MEWEGVLKEGDQKRGSEISETVWWGLEKELKAV